jgi:methylmalonyl-CoA mutase, N-terminal domain
MPDCFTPGDLPDFDYQCELGHPGRYPFTRGIHPTMYHGRLWTMRQYAGFASAEESNRRYRYLLEQGQAGLSVAFDLPTQMGYDSDHPLAVAEVGKVGVPVSTLRDMETLFDQIPLEKVSISMTINSTAPILLAMYIATARKQSATISNLEGTIQNDILKEYIARGTYIFPPQPSMRLATNIFKYCRDSAPRWNVISISGYHMREAGATASQELAFTLANGIAYVQAALDAGLDLASFAPRLSFFFCCHNDFFEEIAKFRAARRLWARIMRERFKTADERSCMLRFHTQTAGCTLTAQQPLNNIVRTALQALAAVLGGTQSLHTDSYDEAYATPSEEAVTVALRTQQVIAFESGVTGAADPMGGSYYLEHLTRKLDKEAGEYIDRIDKLGGAVRAIEDGFQQREIEDSAYLYQKQVESGQRAIVGMNKFISARTTPPRLQRIDPAQTRRQMDRLRQVRQEREHGQVDATLKRLDEAARGSDNLMPPILDCVESYCTLGEICATLRRVLGTQKERAAF